MFKHDFLTQDIPMDDKASILQDNAFLNWKRKQITHNGAVYLVHVKAFVCNIAEDKVGYAIKFKNDTWYIANINHKWVRLDIEHDIAKAFGKEIENHVSRVKAEIHQQKLNAARELRKKK